MESASRSAKRGFVLVAVVLAGIMQIMACRQETGRFARTASGKAPQRLLFVGDSLTYWNMGVYYHVKSLAESESPSRSVIADSVTRGSTPLGGLWPQARDAIRKGHYDLVILQDDLGETSRDGFLEYARKYDEAARKSGSRSVLYLHYWYPYLKYTPEELKTAFRDVATGTNITVSPVFSAFRRVETEKPDLALIGDDFTHPTWAGSYLIACVLYGTIFGKSPEGLAYNPQIAGLSQDDIAYFQRVAWETVTTFSW